MAYTLNEEILYYILLVDKEGYLLPTQYMDMKIKGIKLKGLERFNATKGGLFKKIPHKFEKTKNLVNIVSLDDYKAVIQCQQDEICQLTQVEVEMLLAVPSHIERYDVKQKRNQLTLACKAKVGNHVCVDVNGASARGTLRYIGPIIKTKGTKFGVELNYPIGDNDGKISGTPYFYCGEKHGIFASVEKITFIEDELYENEGYENVGKSASDKDGIYEVARTTVEDPYLICEEPSHLSLGTRVIYYGEDGSRKTGVVRFLDYLISSHGDKTPVFSAGVELDDKSSTTYGNCFEGTKLFDCGSNKGVIVKANKLLREKKDLIDLSSQDECYGGEHGTQHTSDYEYRIPQIYEKSISITDNSSDDPIPCEIDIGSMVEIYHKENLIYGVVKWIGLEERYRNEYLAGVELEDDCVDGTINDGIYLGQRYFKCSPGRGFFTKLTNCKPDQRFTLDASDYQVHSTSGDYDVHSTSGDYDVHSTGDYDVHSTSRDNDDSINSLPSNHAEYDIDIGAVVEIHFGGNRHYGVLRWKGVDKRMGHDELLAGIEIEDDTLNKGCSDGTYIGQRYFSCQDGRGFFTKLRHCKPDTRFTETPSNETNDATKVSHPIEKETNNDTASQTTKKRGSTLSNIQSLCECSICCEMINDPRSLQCEHSFCKECIEEMLKFDEGGIPSIKCPNCNTINIMEKGSTVDSFKPTRMLKRVLEELNDNGARDAEGVQEIPRCCEKTITGYCGQCDAYMCNECIKIHITKSCTQIIDVGFSRAKGIIVPYCKEHSSYKYSACKQCADVVCPYCKETHHKDHKIISLHEYSSIFKGYLTDKLQICKQYSDNVQKIVNNPSNEPSHATKLIADKEMIIMSKCMYILETITNLQKTVVETSTQLPGNILGDKESWIAQQKVFEEELSSAGSFMEKKGLVEPIFHTGCVLGKMSSTFPMSENFGDLATHIVEDEKSDEDLFHVLSSLFGQLHIPRIDRNGNVDMASIKQTQNQMDSLLPQLSTFNDGNIACQYLKDKMKKFL